MVRIHRAALLRVTPDALLRVAVLCRVLFPALMKAGAGKQNAVVVIVVRRYAHFVVVVGLGSSSTSVAMLMIDHSSRSSAVMVT